MGRAAVERSFEHRTELTDSETPRRSVRASPTQFLIAGWQSATATVGVICGAWNRFWYHPADPTVLGIIRLLVGGMLVYTHLVWGINLPAFLGDAGWNSPDVLSVVQQDLIVPSFWWYVGDVWLTTMHWVCISILVAFWLGLATRITSVLSLLITVSYSYRAHMSNYGLDQINAILCLYLCIGPSGAVLSVDRLLKVWNARRRSRKTSQGYQPCLIHHTSSANLAVRLMQIHFCVIYAYAGLSKLQGPAWWSGEAVWLAFANLEYQSADMTWIAWYPWISDLMTHSTIIWEVAFAALVWVRPVRPAVLAIGFLLHAGIGGMMGMWTFALIMIFGHVSFWPRETVGLVVGLIPSAEQLFKVPLLNADDSTGTGIRTGSSNRPGKGTPGRRSLRPALLCVDRNIRQRLQCLHYFLDRGFRCLVTDDTAEAQAVRNATTPNAVVVLGRGIPDDELLQFQQQHYQQNTPQPLFLVLSDEQSQRLNGSIARPLNHVLAGNVSLGHLRREIQVTLEFGSTTLDSELHHER